MRDLRYISGSTHQQHTHGIYARTALHCDGKPVYMQQTGAAPTGAAADCRLGECNSRARGLDADGGMLSSMHMHMDGSGASARERAHGWGGGGGGGGVGGGDAGSNDHRRLYLFSPSGRESWMVGRDACKPSGWLEVRDARRRHVPHAVRHACHGP